MKFPIQFLQRYIQRSFPRVPRGVKMVAILAFVMGLLFGPRVLALLTN